MKDAYIGFFGTIVVAVITVVGHIYISSKKQKTEMSLSPELEEKLFGNKKIIKQQSKGGSTALCLKAKEISSIPKSNIKALEGNENDFSYMAKVISKNEDSFYKFTRYPGTELDKYEWHYLENKKVSSFFSKHNSIHLLTMRFGKELPYNEFATILNKYDCVLTHFALLQYGKAYEFCEFKKGERIVLS